LQDIFKQLLDAGCIERSELGVLPLILPAKPNVRKKRQLHRNYALVPLPIIDLKNLLNEGAVVDITEAGVQISGIPTKLGDMKEFLIQADYFADVYPFVFDAQCRWTSESEGGHLLSGYKITSISEGGLQELEKLTSLLTISG
jgi:hypothetical protein